MIEKWLYFQLALPRWQKIYKWQQQLGYPHHQAVQFLLRMSLIKSSSSKKLNSIHESCQIWKSCRLSFINSSSHSDKPFMKVHSDIWGPAPFCSTKNFRYYVIFIDELTRFTWLYPLKKKFDVVTCFIHFHKYKERQFERKIQIFQSDGGWIFKCYICRIFRRSRDYSLVSCHKTSEHNDIAQWKDKNIQELSLTMLHVTFQKRYWCSCL